MMKILLLNTFDEIGGAARAAGRLLKGLREQKLDASLLVQFKTGTDPAVLCKQGTLHKLIRRLKILLGLRPVRKYPNRPENNFSPAQLRDNKPAEVAAIKPDIIHLHWLCAGFLQVETLAKFNKPLVWTLHDSWAFTGGCHVPFDCTRYRQSCGTCPVLGSEREDDLSNQTWKRKKQAWQNLDLTVVVPSRWLAEAARSSSLFRDVRIERIPYGIDSAQYHPLDKYEARRRLGLPINQKIILFGAVQAFSDPNKGFHLLKDALRIVGRDTADTLAVVFTSMDRSQLTDLGMPAEFLGRVEDELLPELYAAADVFVLPSKSENLPLTIIEAMSCGTPCVAFRQGGLPDQVDHLVSGYLAEPFDVSDLARGIVWTLEDNDRRAELSRNARLKVETEFSLQREAKRYMELYRELLARG